MEGGGDSSTISWISGICRWLLEVVSELGQIMQPDRRPCLHNHALKLDTKPVYTH